jgi:hypothetical protein
MAYDRAVEHAVAPAPALFERARFRLRRGDRSGAARDLSNAVASDPSFEAARQLLRRLREES